MRHVIVARTFDCIAFVFSLIGISFMVVAFMVGCTPALKKDAESIPSNIMRCVLAHPDIDEAERIAMRLGKPPAGFGQWTLRLSADQLVGSEIVGSIRPETVRQTLEKTA